VLVPDYYRAVINATRNSSADEIGECYRLNHAIDVQAFSYAKQLSAEPCACKPLASCLLAEHASADVIVLFIVL